MLEMGLREMMYRLLELDLAVDKVCSSRQTLLYCFMILTRFTVRPPRPGLHRGGLLLGALRRNQECCGIGGVWKHCLRPKPPHQPEAARERPLGARPTIRYDHQQSRCVEHAPFESRTADGHHQGSAKLRKRRGQTREEQRRAKAARIGCFACNHGGAEKPRRTGLDIDLYFAYSSCRRWQANCANSSLKWCPVFAGHGLSADFCHR